MNLHAFKLNELLPYRQKIILFLRKYGEGRITHQALRWLNSITIKEATPGSIVLFTLEEKKLVGVMIFKRYGIEEAITAVHPKYRKQGVGEALLIEAKERLNKIYTRVACDNVPSLKLCFRCGLTAFQLFKGPTGKPTLWLGGGNYDPNDVRVTKAHPN